MNSPDILYETYGMFKHIHDNRKICIPNESVTPAAQFNFYTHETTLCHSFVFVSEKSMYCWIL